VLVEEIKCGSQSVFELHAYASLEKMKEAAGVYYWRKMSNIEQRAAAAASQQH
jgi:hypothetical protein